MLADFVLKKDLDFINEEEKDSKILSKYLNIALSISIVLSVFFLNMLFSLLLFLMGLFIKLIYNKLYKEDYLNYLKDLIPVILENIDQNEKEAMINKHKYEQNTENLKKLLNNQSSIESKINELVGATTYKNNFNSEEYFTKEVDDSKCDEMPQLKKTKSIPNSD